MRTKLRFRGDPARIAVHSEEVVRAYNRMLGRFPGQRRHIELRGAQRIHVIERGDGPPALFLHGTNTSSLSVVPVLEHLQDIRAIAVDRPGHGLSDPPPVARGRFRGAAIEFIDEVLSALRLDTVTLVGQSGGGVWAIWYAMAHPQRVRSLVLLGSAPLLPGTRCPASLRLMATPGLGPMMARLVRPTRTSLVRLLSSIGEGETIVRHPDLVDALVAGGNDRAAVAADLAELRAFLQPFGFRRAMRFRPAELKGLSVPTLLIWGDHDPIGSVDTARAVARLIPGARLEVLSAGHVPQLGHPQRVAVLISDFTRLADGRS
jgi:pimeloyl-ACP methyl ester carboxylesterase